MVWTDNGLLPIEQIKVGDLVLSQPEAKGELVYKRVVKTFEFADKEIWHVYYDGPSTETSHRIFATANHPIWIKGAGWKRVDALRLGDVIELHDGNDAYVAMVGPVYETRRGNIGFVRWNQEGEEIGSLVDFSEDFKEDDGGKNVLGGSVGYSLGECGDGYVIFKRNVFNIEVEDFRTYYVGQYGVWVHNTNGRKKCRKKGPSSD